MEKMIDIESAKKLVTGQWGEQLCKIAVDCSAPFFWVENPGKRDQAIHNGTIFFLDTGSHRFAVSAYHVYKEYLEALSRTQNTICQIFTEKFSPKESVLDFSEQSDLIMFIIDEKFVAKIGKNFLTGHQPKWPPNPPQVQRGLFFAGYPGIERRFDDPLTINWGILRGLCVANSVGEDTISVHFDQEFLVDRPDQIPQGYNSAGISGAPLITLVENENGINYWRLGGVILEGQPKWDVALARRADFILSDGKVGIVLTVHSDD